MATATTTKAAWTWTQDVLSYAVEHGFDQYLDPVLEMTKRVFSNARHIAVCLEPDWEIPDLWFVVFDVEVAGMSPEKASEAQWRWCSELPRECCLRPDCNIVLSVELND
jgi:hypothetical protein